MMQYKGERKQESDGEDEGVALEPLLFLSRVRREVLTCFVVVAAAVTAAVAARQLQ